MSRQFFKKGVANRDRVRPTPRRKVRHKGQAVLTRVQRGDKTLVRLMSSADAAHLVGVSKGGLAIQAAGTAHRFTPEEARKAARRLWDRRWKLSKRTGARLGLPAKRRPGVKRAPLRAQYAEPPPFKGIQFHPVMAGDPLPAGTPQSQHGYWTYTYEIPYPPGQATRVLSERAALTRLGYLASSRKPVPESIEPIAPYGRKPASPSTR